MISFKYFEKPSTTNVMVQKKSALDENSKSQILANELMRRLGNTDQRQEDSVISIFKVFSKNSSFNGLHVA